MIRRNGPYHELVARWETLEGGRVRVRHVDCGSGRSLLCVDINEGCEPAIAITAGVHGDEPSGPWALLALAEAGELDPRCAYRIWPCTNPSGFLAQTRSNADGADINRTFGGDGESPEARAILRANHGRRFALSLDLHEDCDAQGFYCYEYGAGALGSRVIAALEKRGLAIDPLEVTLELAGPLDDTHCTRERGRIVADADEEAILLGGLSYSLAMARSARRALTFESPSGAPWATRIEMHRVAVIAACDALLEESDSALAK
jgi:murein peptide amidase A